MVSQPLVILDILISYLFIPQLAVCAEHVGVVSRIANKLSLKESHVEAGGVVVHKLEEEHLHRQFVLVLQVCLWDFCRVRFNKT